MQKLGGTRKNLANANSRAAAGKEAPCLSAERNRQSLFCSAKNPRENCLRLAAAHVRSLNRSKTNYPPKHLDAHVKTPAHSLVGSSLRWKTIAVIGFGSQGKAQAQNLKDSGFNVIVGLKKGSKSIAKAKAAGFRVYGTGEAAKRADFIQLLVPDEIHGEVYAREIMPWLSNGKTLCFSHGFSIVFGLIKAPENIDVVLVSPKAPGKSVRSLFLEGKKAHGVFAVWQDSSGRARGVAKEYANAIGLDTKTLGECTFEQETNVNLFAEQAVLCGGLAELVKAGFETLVNAGYPKKLAYVEVVHQIKLLADLIHEGGISYMWSEVSNTAEYGGRSRGKKIIGHEVKSRMKKLLSEIESGEFAEEWVAEYKSGMNKMRAMRKEQDSHELDKTGAGIRALFSRSGGDKA